MAESQHKRLREDEDSILNPNSKRQKPHTNILDAEIEPQISDLSAIFTTLEQDLPSSPTAFDFDSLADESDHHNTAAAAAVEEDDGVNSVIRHLLEASDDELGLPNTDYANEIKSDENFPFEFVDNGIWELEDVAANYYAVLQAELFM